MRQYREEKQQCTVHLIVENPFIFILSSSLCVCLCVNERVKKKISFHLIRFDDHQYMNGLFYYYKQ